MPHRPDAIQLNTWTLDTIHEHLNVPKLELLDELHFANLRDLRVYYVKNALYFSNIMPYLVYTETEFLENFATKPKGIEDHFVSVLQVEV